MSDNIDLTEITAIIHSIKEDDTNEVHFSYFVLAAKSQILNSTASFNTSDQLRKFWIRTVTNITAKYGYNLNIGADNWFLINREFQKITNAVSTSTAPPAPSPSPSSSSPATLHSTPLSPFKAPRAVSPVTRRSSTISTSRSSSSLGMPMSNFKKENCLSFYNSMSNDQKWKLKSGRYVEDIMASFVDTLEFEHPSMHCILDMHDKNWEGVFSDEERSEINETAKAAIEYPELPNDMRQFLQDIPNTTDLDQIYRHLEGQSLDPATQAPLVYLKFCLQHAILLFNANYFPINDRNERDLCANIWQIIGRAFDRSMLTFEIEKSSNASKEANSKKRKIAANDYMERQQNALIPDMTISYIKQEYAVIEAAKSKDDTKQITEGGKKCPELMVKIFNQLLEICPTEQRTIKIYGCLLSKLNCTPMELSSPKGYVKLFKRSNTMQHPESSAVFKTRMCTLLAHFWKFRLAIEAMCATMIQAENEQSEFA